MKIFVLNLFKKMKMISFRSDSFKYIYEQQALNDVTTLKPILPCFGLFPEEPLGLYLGVLRFTANRYKFYLVGSKSPLYTSSWTKT